MNNNKLSPEAIRAIHRAGVRRVKIGRYGEGALLLELIGSEPPPNTSLVTVKHRFRPSASAVARVGLGRAAWALNGLGKCASGGKK